MTTTKRPARKLLLDRETVRKLADQELAKVGGGYGWTLTLGVCCPPVGTAKCTVYPCLNATAFCSLSY